MPDREGHVAKLTRRVLGMPLHRYLNLELLEQSPGLARLSLPVTEASANLAGVLHGGVMYAVLDVACYLALLPCLEAETNAVTCDIHVSVLRPAPLGAVLELEGTVTRQGRSLAFCAAQARLGDKLMGVAQVTKSLVPSTL